MSARIFTRTFLFAMIFLGLSCHQPRSPRFLTIDGGKEVFNYLTFSGQNSDTVIITPIIPVLDGDLIAMEEGAFQYSNPMKTVIDLKDSSGVLYLNSEVIVVRNSFIEQNLPSVNNITPGKQILVIIDTTPGKPTERFLQNIEKEGTPLGVSFNELSGDSTEQSIQRTLAYSDPKMVLTDADSTLLVLLKNEKKLESLYIFNDDDHIIRQLPPIPTLKSFSYWGDTITNELLQKNPQIENLSILQFQSPAALNGMVHLRSLSMSFCEELDLTILSGLKKIDRLIINGDSVKNIHILQQLRNLRWLRIPEETTQDQFDTIVMENPKLEMLEIFSGDRINTLSGLRECRALRGLMFYGDTMYTKRGLTELSNLKYLSFPAKTFKDTNYIRMMKKNFPNTQLVPNNGICLGSGWILLLIPVTILVAFLLRRKIFVHA